MNAETDPGGHLALLREIAHCPVISQCMQTSGDKHPCMKIVQSQNTPTTQSFQIPEPWSGHIETAPVLFVSSNPSIGFGDLYPRWQASDEALADYFQERFARHICQGINVRLTKGSYAEAVRLGYPDEELPMPGESVQWGKSVSFWAQVKGRAQELFDKPVRPGIDYAITEVVHCKSVGERGVAEAKGACADRYLKRVIAVSAARVIIVLGVKALPEMQRIFPEANIDRSVIGPTQLAGQERYVAYLPHPNARAPRAFGSLYTEDLPHLHQFSCEATATALVPVAASTNRD